MSKKRFIQDVLIRNLPALDKVPEAISYAEGLWDAISQHGYGQTAAATPRENKDWYQSLTPRQKEGFNRFWNAFKYKYGRDGAAMRWSQLGELSDKDYQKIIDAAEKEGSRQLPPGQSRMMAQGWLHEKRYQDYQAVEKPKQDQKKHVITHLYNELNGIKILYNNSGDEALLAQISKLEQAIKDARRE